MDSNHRPDGKQPSALPTELPGNTQIKSAEFYIKTQCFPYFRVIKLLTRSRTFSSGTAADLGACAVERPCAEPLARLAQRADTELAHEPRPAARAPGPAGLGRQRAQEIGLRLGRRVAVALD